MSHGPSPNSSVSLDQFLEGIISLFITRFGALHFLSLLPLAAVFFAAGFLVSALARGFAAALATAFLAGAFFFATFGASSSASAGVATTFSFFGRGPMEGLALSARISVMRSTVISSR